MSRHLYEMTVRVAVEVGNDRHADSLAREALAELFVYVCGAGSIDGDPETTGYSYRSLQRHRHMREIHPDGSSASIPRRKKGGQP